MNRLFINLFSQSAKLSIYTLKYEDSDANLTDAFIDEYQSYTEDIQIIRSWLNNLKVRGAEERYFRPERNVRAGPIGMSKLRIYCIRCTNQIIILDGGGVKKGAKTQDGKETLSAMDLMIAIDKQLIKKIQEGEIHYSDDYMTLEGNLFVDI